jgi:hypothetical protein
MSKLIQSVTIAALACGTNAGAGDWGTPDKVTSRLQVQVRSAFYVLRSLLYSSDWPNALNCILPYVHSCAIQANRLVAPTNSPRNVVTNATNS